jgi:hypothetical protein
MSLRVPSLARGELCAMLLRGTVVLCSSKSMWQCCKRASDMHGRAGAALLDCESVSMLCWPAPAPAGAFG